MQYESFYSIIFGGFGGNMYILGLKMTPPIFLKLKENNIFFPVAFLRGDLMLSNVDRMHLCKLFLTKFTDSNPDKYLFNTYCNVHRLES